MALWGNLTPEEKDDIVSQHDPGNGITWNVLAKQYNIENSPDSFSRMARNHKAIFSRSAIVAPRPDNVNQRLVRALQAGPKTLLDLSNRLDISPSKVLDAMDELRSGNVPITATEEGYELPEKPVGNSLTPITAGKKTTLVFATSSDEHFGSKFVQKSSYKSFIHEAYNEYGVKYVLHAGDWTAGKGVYRGQEHEVYAVSVDEQAEDVVEETPRYDDLLHIGIGGNHDYSHYKRGGHDVLLNISKQRDDIIYAGWDEADVPLTPNIDIKLFHPTGGQTYALSYRGQRYGAQISAEELMAAVVGEKTKPTVRMVVIGHLHVFNLFIHGPMWIVQQPCWEGTTGYLRQKGLRPVIGGIIWQVEIDEIGMIASITPTIRIYPEVEDDYKSHRIPIATKSKSIQLETMFTLLDKGETNG